MSIADWAAKIARAALPQKRIEIGPWKGSVRSIPADRVPLDFIAGGTDFLYIPRSGYWKRRKGQTQQFDSGSAGMLPAKWGTTPVSGHAGAKCRQMEEYISPYISDGIPTVMALLTTETITTGLDDGRYSQVWFRDQVNSTNYTVGSEFSTSTYPDPGAVQSLKFVPLWYDSGDGGITRGVTEFARRFFFSGSRRFQKVGGWHYFPSVLGTPSRWKLTSIGSAQTLTTSIGQYSNGGYGITDGIGGSDASLALLTNDGDTSFVNGAVSTQGALVGEEVSLATIPAVTSYTGWKLHIIAKKTGGTNVCDDTVTVYGATAYDSGTHVFTHGAFSIPLGLNWLRDRLTASYTDITYDITPADALSLTLQTIVTVKFTSNGSNGSGSATDYEKITQVYLEIPAAGATTTEAAGNRLIPSGPLPPTHAGTLAVGTEISNSTTRAMPDADVDDGFWVKSSDGLTGSLYTMIDETDFVDSDYITTPENQTDTTAKISLSDPGIVPTPDDTVKIRLRVRPGGSAVAGKLTVLLYDGVTQIKSAVVAMPTLSANFVTAEVTLTADEISAVSAAGWANLTVWLAKSQLVPVTNCRVQVGWLQLQITVSPGTRGGWSGFDKFYHSVAYRWEDDSIWMPCTPRGPQSGAAATSPLTNGYNLFQVNASNPDAGYDSIVWSNIPIGPNGVKGRILLRTPKIDTRTESTLQLDPTDLRVVWEIKDNTTTTYLDFFADDDSLTLDPDELLIRDDHIMTPRSRYFFGGDVRDCVSYSGLNPCAIEFAPVQRSAGSNDITYDLNVTDDTAAAYSNNSSYYKLANASALNTTLTLATDTGAATTTYAITITSTMTLELLVDTINATLFSVNGVQWRAQMAPGANPQALAATALTPTSRAIASCTILAQTISGTGLSKVAVGDFITGTGVTAGAYVSIINSDTLLTFVGTITPATVTLTFVKNTGDNIFGGTDYDGYVRVIANSLPGFLYFNKTYLGQFPIQKSSVFMTVASPGAVKSAANCWSGKISNEHKPPVEAGISMGGFAVDNGFVVPFSQKSAAIRNTRDTGSGVDSDYKLFVLNESRGCCAWQSIAAGSRAGAFFAPEGWVASDLYSEALISEAIYHHAKSDAVSGTGGVGDFAYEVQKCIGATAADTDTAYMISRIMRGALWINYRNSSSVTRPDRQVVYDFSEGRTDTTRGLASMLRGDGSSWGWSLPLIRPFTAMTEGRRDTGTHLYGWNDANAGSTGDGRIDEFEISDTDNSTYIAASLLTGWIRVGENQLSAQEVTVEHSSPDGTVALKFVRGITVVVTGDSYTLTPSTSSTLVVIRDVKMLPLAARVSTAACYLEWDNTTGSASELRHLELRVKSLPSYK